MIKGKLVSIRPVRIGDEIVLHRWWTEGSFMAHASLQYGTLETREMILEKIKSDHLHKDRRRFVVLNEEDAIIGEMGYTGYQAKNQKSEFGIKIFPPYQGKGYGQDALVHFIDFMFRYLNLNKIELTSMMDNDRAHTLYEKIGFKKIGVCRQACFDSRTGEFADVLYMDLLKKEWQENRKTLLER
jgi:RimJ/RimL family protein N-acetyltransferase